MWTIWNILGVSLSILCLLCGILPIPPNWLHYSKIEYPNFGDYQSVPRKSKEYFGQFLENLVQVFNALLPLPTVSSVEKLGEYLKQPRNLTHKPVHILCILLAMIICLLMFSAQLWYIATTPWTSEYCLLFYDCEEALAMTNFGLLEVESRKAVILICTPVTFLLCIILLLLIRRPTVLRLVLYEGIDYVHY